MGFQAETRVLTARDKVCYIAIIKPRLQRIHSRLPEVQRCTVTTALLHRAVVAPEKLQVFTGFSHLERWLD